MGKREDALKDVLNALPEYSKLDEFVYDSYQNGYWDVNTGFLLKEVRSVNALIPKEYWPLKIVTTEEGKEKEVLIKPATWLADVSNGQLVDSSTWWPGKPRVLSGYLAVEGAMIADSRRKLFNTYRPGPEIAASARNLVTLLKEAERWADHIRALWPDKKEHDFFFDYCAHMVQHPEVKANSIVTLSGEQGIGKDVALLPVKSAIGQWNVRDISPDDIASNYNPWAQCIMLVINEMRPTKEDFHASSMYEKLKTLSVTPPDMLAISDKFLRQRFIVNVLRVFITTNKMHSMYIDPNDRRMGAVLHSPKLQGWASSTYFSELVGWLENKKGNLAVALWLAHRNIASFQPKAKPEATAGWHAIVSGWTPPQDAVAAALEQLRDPDAFFAAELLKGQFEGIDDIRGMLKHPRKLQHRLQLNGYFMKSFDSPLEFRPVVNTGKPFKSKLAFVKSSLMHEELTYMNLLRARGQMIADEVAILNQTPQRKEAF